VYCKPILEEPTLDAALEKLGARRAVVGHTPTSDRRVRALYGGKLVMLDTGMLADYYGGRPAALVSDSSGLTVRYAAPSASAAPENGRTAAYARTDAELRAALERGAIGSVRRGASSEPWLVAVQDGDAALDAAFYPERGRRADAELAAAALDDLLGTDLVAPTVARTIEGQDGALQLKYPGAVSERRRAEQRLAFSGWCPIEPQLELTRAFDVLILNGGRTVDTVLYANELTDVMLVDHGRAFATSTALPASARDLPMPAHLREALRALDEPRLAAELGAWLDARQIRALLARRDRLVGGAAR
jgi:hypothetical protein